MKKESYDIFTDGMGKEEKRLLEIDQAGLDAVFDVAILIEDSMKHYGLKAKELAEKAGVSAAYISKVLNAQENLSIKNVAKILYAMGHKLHVSSSPLDQSSIDFVEPGRAKSRPRILNTTTKKWNANVNEDVTYAVR